MVFYHAFFQGARSEPALVMKRNILTILLLASMVLGLPLLGILMKDMPLAPFFAFPPKTRHVDHAPFSWAVFVGYAALILLVIVPFLSRVFLIRGIGHRHIKRRRVQNRASGHACSFPWWGWAGILWTLFAWVIAWSRFSWSAPLQAHTFSPLWMGYIIVVNALTYRRTGACMALDRPGRFLCLFPLSAAFWWFFEYLNRFVENWSYVGVDFGPWEYFWYATLPFSTVLPAVLGTRDLLLGFSWPKAWFGAFLPVRVSCPRMLAWVLLLAAATGLTGIGIRPNALFPLVWISPLLIIICLQTVLGERHLLSTLPEGDWHVIVCSALGALICGFFWEMWNFYSLAKWEYRIPFVHGFRIFEMPLLGYAGYLPFGLGCTAVGQIAGKWFRRS